MRQLNSPLAISLFFLFVILATGATLVRAYKTHHEPGPIEGANFGFCDFHNGIYFPAQAIAARVSPYGQEYGTTYPVPRSTPLYAPSTFLIHWPFAWMSMRAGELVYFSLTFIMAIALAMLSIKCSKLKMSLGMVLFTTLGVVVSRAGYGTFYSGYFTFELVLGTIVALQWGDKPWVGGLGLLFASTKPTYAIPLAIIMAARGHWRALGLGILLNSVLSLAVIAWLLPGRPWDFLLQDIRFGQSQHMADRAEMPEFSWTRVDVVALVAKWLPANPSELIQLLWMFLLLPLPVWLLVKLKSVDKTTAAGGISGTLALLTMNVTVYHHYYDMLVLFVPVIAIAFNQHLWPERSATRFGLAILILFPLMNYFSTNLFFGRMGISDVSAVYQVVTSLNSVCLLVALLWVMAIAWNRLRNVHLSGTQTSKQGQF